MDKISKHVSYKEATRSATAARMNLNNAPDEDQIKCMGILSEKIFEPLRKHV